MRITTYRNDDRLRMDIENVTDRYVITLRRFSLSGFSLYVLPALHEIHLYYNTQLHQQLLFTELNS
jgi:hypothetical protein